MYNYTSDHCKIKVLKELKTINIKWLGYPRTNEFKTSCNKALELMIENKCSKFLTDNTEAVVFSTNDQKWLNIDWLSRAQKAGYKASAVLINSKQNFAKLAVENIIKSREKTFLAKEFTNEAEAMEWLKSLD